MNNLTVILTLFGRPLHTLRWVWHANRIKLPFHVIVADGDVHPVVERVLSSHSNFPNLSYEYKKYADLSFTDFYRKCAESASMVRTPYAMMSDNDDFLFVSGILKSIAYLDQDPEYVCAGGEIPEFGLAAQLGRSENIVGEMQGLRFGYFQGVHDIAHPLASNRVMDVLNRYHVTYYHVYRTSALKQIFNEVQEYDFTDLTIHEYFLAARTASLGKVKSDPSVMMYIRQTGTSTPSTYYKGDWVDHLLRSDLPRDSRKMAVALAIEIERLEGANREAFMDRILGAYSSILRHMLANTMLRYRFPLLFHIKLSLSAMSPRRLIPHSIRTWLSTQKFWSKLARACPDLLMLNGYRAELKDIAISLRGDAFLTFTSLRAPELLGMKTTKS